MPGCIFNYTLDLQLIYNKSLSCNVYRAVASSIIGERLMFVYSCSAQLICLEFDIYQPPIIELTTALVCKVKANNQFYARAEIKYS